MDEFRESELKKRISESTIRRLSLYHRALETVEEIGEGPDSNPEPPPA